MIATYSRLPGRDPLFVGLLISFRLLFLLLPVAVEAQSGTDCSSAPNEGARSVCMSMTRMDQSARERARRQQPEVFAPSIPGTSTWQRPIPVPFNSRGQVAAHPYECMTLQCLCPFFFGAMRPDGYCYLQRGNGPPLAMAYRKEYRTMSDNERQRFHYALSVLKNNGEYDRLSAQHLAVGAGSGAHSGPGFLPWHREYLKRVEIAIRLIDPTLAIPYWDNVMESYLPNPAHSMLFTPDFMGETNWNGFVVNGPFAFWRTLEGRPAITRNLGRQGSLMTEQQLNTIFSQSNIEYILAYTVPQPGCPYPANFFAPEYVHSFVHLWLGGDMQPPETSANDPIFFLHHSFLDLVWEIWRSVRQPRWIREQAYSMDIFQCANPLHFGNAPMHPFFGLINRDGLSNSYTDQLYRYAPRPTCSLQIPDCGSKYLFCDTRGFPHCVAKIRLGGFCAGFERWDACWNGQCIFGRCVPGPTPPPFRLPTSTPTPPPSPSRARARAFSSTIITTNTTTTTMEPSLQHGKRQTTFVDCFNRNPCCESWAREGECNRNEVFMLQFCRAACKQCQPTSFNSSSSDCIDRHISCQQWKELGHCEAGGESILFVEENCRRSCDFCAESKRETCLRQGTQSHHSHNVSVSISKKPPLSSTPDGSDLRLGAARHR